MPAFAKWKEAARKRGAVKFEKGAVPFADSVFALNAKGEAVAQWSKRKGLRKLSKQIKR